MAQLQIPTKTESSDHSLTRKLVPKSHQRVHIDAKVIKLKWCEKQLDFPVKQPVAFLHTQLPDQTKGFRKPP